MNRYSQAHLFYICPEYIQPPQLTPRRAVDAFIQSRGMTRNRFGETTPGELSIPGGTGHG